jgi:hypothetical protein
MKTPGIMKKSIIGAVSAVGVIAAVTACGSTTTVIHDPALVIKPVPAVTKTVTAKPVSVTVKTSAAPMATTPSPVASPSPVYVPVYVTPTPVYAPPQYTNALSVVDQYYQDITDQNYQAAWNLGGDNLNGNNSGNYASWVAGYSTTASISLYDSAPFGSGEVTTYLSALQSDGTTTTYYGTYYVSDGVITSANISQTS